MIRTEAYRFRELEVFVEVVEQGGLSAAARALGMSPSSVSKLIGRMETRLAGRLLHRSTRRLALTAEGAAFYEHAVRLLADLAEAEQAVSAGAAVRGRVRVNCNVAVGRHHLLPLLPGFLSRYPDVTLDVVLTDQVVDLLDERADLAIRTGPLHGSQLTARKLGESRMAVVASPAYLARRGVPACPADLARHERIGFDFQHALGDWPFRSPQGPVTMPVCGALKAGDGETVRDLALAGGGLARLALFHVGADIEAGRLVEVLADYNPGDRQPVHAVYVGGRADLPARVRVLLDYLSANLDLGRG